MSDAASPFTIDTFRTICTRSDAEGAGVPLSTFYAWKAGNGDLLARHLIALIRIKGLYMRIVTTADRDALARRKDLRQQGAAG